jgi:cell division protease FtsH
MQATDIARSMVTEYGMSEAIGPVYLAGPHEVFLGKSFAQQQNFSDDLAARIDAEIRRIMDEQSARALDILAAHREGIERVAAYLLEHEQITGDEFTQVFENRPEAIEAPETPALTEAPDAHDTIVDK